MESARSDSSRCVRFQLFGSAACLQMCSRRACGSSRCKFCFNLKVPPGLPSSSSSSTVNSSLQADFGNCSATQSATTGALTHYHPAGAYWSCAGHPPYPWSCTYCPFLALAFATRQVRRAKLDDAQVVPSDFFGEVCSNVFQREKCVSFCV